MQGGFEFKSAVVETLVQLMTQLPATLDNGLFHLCEFIEDCEFEALSCRVISYIAQEGPKTKAPARYIRFIYNRVLLESPAVRAAAVSALARFGAALPALRPSLQALLNRAQQDEDDEVRDRATLALLQLGALGDRPPPGAEAEESKGEGKEGGNGLVRAAGRVLLVDPLPVSVRSLERALTTYKLRPAAGALSIATLPIVEEVSAAVRGTDSVDASVAGASTAGDNTAPEGVSGETSYAEALYAVPEFAELGPLFKSCREVNMSPMTP